MAVGNFLITSKIVVITGGGSDNKVIIADVRLTTEAERLVKESKDVIFARCDVTVHADLEALIKISEKEFGDVPDVYITGAGLFERPSFSFWDHGLSGANIYSMININLHPIPFTRIAMSAVLQKDKKGVVVVLSSLAGLHPSYPTPLYNGTKHALVGFVKSMMPADREEGIKVCAICPGLVSTPLWADPGLKAQFPGTEPGMLPASTVANAMMSLAEEGRYGGGTLMTLTREGGARILPEDGYWALLEMVADTAYAPVRETLKEERGSGIEKCRQGDVM